MKNSASCYRKELNPLLTFSLHRILAWLSCKRKSHLVSTRQLKNILLNNVTVMVVVVVILTVTVILAVTVTLTMMLLVVMEMVMVMVIE